MQPPAFSTLHHLQADIAATREAWAHYAAFLTDRSALADCEWLSIREQLWKVEDFLARWRPQARQGEGQGSSSKAQVAGGGSGGVPDAAEMVLLKEVDLYSRLVQRKGV